MKFKDLLLRAKNCDSVAVEEIMAQYKPLIIKESFVNGVFDEDLYQEFCLLLIHCISKFTV